MKSKCCGADVIVNWPSRLHDSLCRKCGKPCEITNAKPEGTEADKSSVINIILTPANVKNIKSVDDILKLLPAEIERIKDAAAKEAHGEWYSPDATPAESGWYLAQTSPGGAMDVLYCSSAGGWAVFGTKVIAWRHLPKKYEVEK